MTTTGVFRRVFGAPKKAELTAKDGIASLRGTLQLMELRSRTLQTKIDQETTQATAFMRQRNRRAALPCMKRRKTYEFQLDQLIAQRFNIEQQVMSLEAANIGVSTVQAMKVGTQSMQAVYKDIDVGDVDELALDVQEQMNVADRVNEAISQPLNSNMQLAMGDDDELLAELEEIDAQRVDADLLPDGAPSAAATVAAPPDTEPVPASTAEAAAPVAAVNEEEEMRALEVSMTM